MRVAVIGGGTAGLGAAYELVKAGVEVVLYEKEDYLGGHAKTVHYNGVKVDLGFMTYDRVTHPNMMELFENLGIDMEPTDMSFSVSLDNAKGCEWGNISGLRSLFAQKRNAVNPYFWKMLREIIKFKDDMLMYLEKHENNPDINRNETLGHFISSGRYSELLKKAFLIPLCASTWSCQSDSVLNFPALSTLSAFRNHHMFQILGRPQGLTVRGGSRCYVNKVKNELEARGCQVNTNAEVLHVSTRENGCTVLGSGLHDEFEACVVAVQASDALRILDEGATYDEARILGAFQYVYSDIYVHHDKKFMPRNPVLWSTQNFLGNSECRFYLTYWLNAAQSFEKTDLSFFLTVNPPHPPESKFLKWSTSHPIPTVAATNASLELGTIQGTRGIWFCGSYLGHGFCEDGLKAGISAAHGLLGRRISILTNPKQMVPSWKEAAARLFVTRFFKRFISVGCLILLEDGGTVWTFEGSSQSCPLRVAIRVHSPQFYLKVAKEADLGFADAYIHGDISFVDECEGLLNFFMLCIANIELNSSASTNTKRGRWTPVLFTAAIASVGYMYRHACRRNTLTQARRNISRHYDLSNEMFSFFLDETMTYTCAIFKSENEDLKVAQMRKILLLIEKAKVEAHHEVLDIGCGWGALAVEVVKRTGCGYTGITLSEEQLKFAEHKVKEAGLQDRIRFLLCDYRQLPEAHKYDRIISCEMIEAVGHEYMEEFFRCCETALAPDGLMVLQFSSVPDDRYDEYRVSPGFIKEYIFPGGCLPSLNRVTSAMATASKLNVEHLENIGIHYYQTLRCWRKNFLEHQSQILALGFDEKFIRTWEYYFDYCAAGFKTRTLGNYQIVFSRPGNVAAFSDPYAGIPSAHCHYC